jgi:hypothetical protein
MGQRKIFASAVFLAVLMMAFPAVGLVAGESRTDTIDLSTTESSVLEAYGRLPLLFIENQGQVDEAVRYYVKAPGEMVYFTEENIVFDLVRSDGVEANDTANKLVFSLDFLRANSQPAIDGSGKDSAVVNYFIGNDPENWYANVPTYGELVYSDIYPNIDLRLYGDGGMLRYDFVVNPGATPETIALAYNGIDNLAIMDGELIVGTAFGDMVQSTPYIYQEIRDEVVEVEGGFRLGSDNTYGFCVAAYNSHYPLIIDPVLLDYSTYLGGTYDDGGNGIAVDLDNHAYVTGMTGSADFPTTVGTYQVALAGGYDAFVTKLSPTGDALVYSTYLGGSDDDKAYSITVDLNNHTYITGLTESGDFPTQNPFQGALVGAADAFVTKLSADGSALVYSTYLGGEEIDWGYAIALDTDNYAYVTGDTRSPLLFPTQNPYQATLAGGTSDVFVTKMAQDGASLVYSTYLGGSGDELGEGIAVDSDNHAYVDGYTNSDSPTPFPTTVGAYQSALGGEVDAFVTKLSSDGSSLVYSTYLGGALEDYAHDIALDSEGHAYATGKTESDDFPTTPGAFQLARVADYDVFVTKLSLAGDALAYSTYLGGDGFDLAEGIDVDPDNHAYVAGETRSDTDFPVTYDAFQPAYAGGVADAFATKLSPAGDALVYSSYLGGTGWDIGTGIALDPDNHAYVSGWTQSSDFPTTDGAFMENPGGVSYPDTWDAFASKIVAPCDLGISSTAGGSVADPGEGTLTYEKGTVVNLEAAPDSGYDFDNWTGDVGTIADAEDATTTITMQDDYSITANFEEIPSVQYDLSITSTEGGSVTTPGEGTFNYTAGTIVDLVATPDAGYLFVEWTGDVDTIADVNATATTITVNGDYSITANFEEIPSVQYNLSINSTENGTVTTPGEGTFNYTAGTLVDLMATPDAGYRFVDWTGDVDTIADVNAATTSVTMNGNYSITADFVAVEAGDVGIKAGDWIKLEYNITGLPADEPYPEWFKLEFLSLNGTSANVRVTLHMSDGTEQINTVPVDVVAGDEASALLGFVIPANLTTGDSIYMAGYGNVTIEGEATRTYAGANRTVVYASFSQDETQAAYCWDKLTGVIVEISSTSPSITATAKATETNMWETAETTTGRLPWWPWIIVGVVAVGLVIFFMRRRGAD